MHYSEKIKKELTKIGWDELDGHLSKVFKNVHGAGELSDGSRIVDLELSEDSRYFEAWLGFNLLIDLDGRNFFSDPKAGAIEFDKATKEALSR